MFFTAEIQRNPTKNGSWCCRAKFSAEFVGPGLLPLPRLGSCPGHPGVGHGRLGPCWTKWKWIDTKQHSHGKSPGYSWVNQLDYKWAIFNSYVTYYQKVDIQISQIHRGQARLDPINLWWGPLVDPTQLLAIHRQVISIMVESHVYLVNDG